MENPRGWGFLCEIPSVVGIWIFSGTTHNKFARSTNTNSQFVTLKTVFYFKDDMDAFPAQIVHVNS